MNTDIIALAKEAGFAEFQRILNFHEIKNLVALLEAEIRKEFEDTERANDELGAICLKLDDKNKALTSQNSKLMEALEVILDSGLLVGSTELHDKVLKQTYSAIHSNINPQPEKEGKE